MERLPNRGMRTVLALAAAGLGVALVPAPSNKVAIPHLTYRPVAKTDIVADLVLLSRANETEGAVRAFLSLARLRSVAS
jgi:DNA-binding transcriptional LysR family regulator